MATIKGGDLMLFMNGKSIAYATNHTLNISAETVDTSNKDIGAGVWQSQEIGILSWTGTSENLYAIDSTGDSESGKIGNTYETLFDAMVAKTPVDIVLATEGNSTNFADGKITNVYTAEQTASNGYWTAGSPSYEGKAIITSLELNAPNGEDATFSVEFTGHGPLNKVKN